MSDDALLATMTELANYLTLRSEHRANIEEAQQALAKLEGEIVRLRVELAGHLANGKNPARVAGGIASAASMTPERRMERSRKAIAPPSDAQTEMLAKLRAAPEEGLPTSEIVPRGKRGSAAPLGQLCRKGKARKLPNGNWVAA